MIHKFVGLINREQPAEMKHDKQVCKSIYRGQSAEYSVIHRFPAISTESNLPKINMRNRFTTRFTEGSPELYSKHVPIVPVLVKLWSGLVNFGSWWPDRASYKNMNEKTFKMQHMHC